MAKAKGNKMGLYACIACVVVVIAVVVGIIIANNGNKGDEGGSGSGSSNVEYSSVDTTIAYGDYDGMQTLSKDIQNGYATGKIVKIEGLVSHPMSSYSIVQANEDGSQKIGTQFIIDDAEDDEYPEDGDRIVITGEVIEKSPMVFVIKTTKNNVEKQ